MATTEMNDTLREFHRINYKKWYNEYIKNLMFLLNSQADIIAVILMTMKDKESKDEESKDEESEDEESEDEESEDNSVLVEAKNEYKRLEELLQIFEQKDNMYNLLSDYVQKYSSKLVYDEKVKLRRWTDRFRFMERNNFSYASFFEREKDIFYGGFSFYPSKTFV